jgi:hypothetical protein
VRAPVVADSLIVGERGEIVRNRSAFAPMLRVQGWDGGPVKVLRGGAGCCRTAEGVADLRQHLQQNKGEPIGAVGVAAFNQGDGHRGEQAKDDPGQERVRGHATDGCQGVRRPALVLHVVAQAVAEPNHAPEAQQQEGEAEGQQSMRAMSGANASAKQGSTGEQAARYGESDEPVRRIEHGDCRGQ